jgi:hypothetical protein
MLGAGTIIEGEACRVSVSTSVQALHYRRYCGKSSGVWGEKRCAECDESGLPFWEEAIATEVEAGVKISAYAARVRDPLLREAIALQGSEEVRHTALLSTLLTRYDVRISERPPAQLRVDPERALVGIGYGECIDSFVA